MPLHATPRTILDEASTATRRRPRDLPVLAHGDLRTCPGSLTAQGPTTTRDKRRRRHGLPLSVTASAPPTTYLSRLHNPARTTPANASPAPSRTPAHDSGPSRIATPYDVENSHLLLHAGLSRRTTGGTSSHARPCYSHARTSVEWHSCDDPGHDRRLGTPRHLRRDRAGR